MCHNHVCDTLQKVGMHIPVLYNDMLDSLRHMRHNQNSEINKTLLGLYPDKWVGEGYIRSVCSDYRLVTRMLAHGYIKTTDRGHAGGLYGITERGRLRVLCHNLGVSFLGLCMLAEAYAVRAHQVESGLEPAYPISDLMDIFDGIYTKKTIQNTASKLCAAGLAVSASYGMLKLTGRAVREIAACEEAIMDLHGWIAGVSNELNIMALEEPQRLGRIIR